MALLYERPELEVRADPSMPISIMTRSQVVVWPENSIADRQWMLDNFPGASGAIVMLAEKVCRLSSMNEQGR